MTDHYTVGNAVLYREQMGTGGLWAVECLCGWRRDGAFATGTPEMRNTMERVAEQVGVQHIDEALAVEWADAHPRCNRAAVCSGARECLRTFSDPPCEDEDDQEPPPVHLGKTSPESARAHNHPSNPDWHAPSNRVPPQAYKLETCTVCGKTYTGWWLARHMREQHPLQDGDE